MEFLLSANPASALVAVAVSALACLGIGAVSTSIFARSLPGKVIRTAAESEEASAEALRKVNDLKTEWQSTLEQLEHYLEQVERKRRSLQGAEARMRAHLEAEQQQQSNAEEASGDRLARLRLQVYGRGGAA